MSTETIDKVVPTVPAVSMSIQLCGCGHERDAHEHHRLGNDCGVCGPVRCKRYRRRVGRGVRSSIGRLAAR